MDSSPTSYPSAWIHQALCAAFLAGVLAATGAAAAETRTTFVETFGDATNEGGWTYGTGNEYFVDANGNPGRYLRDSHVVTFTPRASTSFGVPSAFTGDYRARGVTSLGIDLAIAAVDGGVASRKLTLILLNDNGTPNDLSDDWGAYTVTTYPLPPTGVIGLIPSDILQWASYDIPVPSDEWVWINRNTRRPGGSWSRLMKQVDHVGFIFGDPAQLYPLFNWDVAMDNPRITTVN